jgi:hypothetical protein
MFFSVHISQHNVRNHLPYLSAGRRDRETYMWMGNHLGDATEQWERPLVDGVMDTSNRLIQELIASSIPISVFL